MSQRMSGCTRRQFHALALASAGGLLLPGCPSGVEATLTPEGGAVTLDFQRFPALRSPGGSAVVQLAGAFPLAVVRTSDTEAAALSATCTHAGCILRFAEAANQLHCDCHDADFALSGVVLDGPTVIPLPTYAATVGADAITVQLG